MFCVCVRFVFLLCVVFKVLLCNVCLCMDILVPQCYVVLSCCMCANRSTAGMHRWKKKAAPQVRLTAVQSVTGASSADIAGDFAEIFFAKEAAC